MFDVTILIKTFERPDCLERCINSIRKYYPNILILVADDSEYAETFIGDKLKIYSLPFDIGLSYGRNYLLDKVETKYILLIDDDFEFIDETDISKFKSILDKYDDIDLIGGGLREPNDIITHYEIDFKLDDGKLYYLKDGERKLHKYPRYDMVLNFFMARTDKIKQIRWDDDLKIVEHTDFFLRGKEKGLVCVYYSGVIVNHNKDNNNQLKYNKYRHRGGLYYDKMLKKHGLKEVINKS